MSRVFPGLGADEVSHRSRDLPITRSYRYACPPEPDTAWVDLGDAVRWSAPGCRFCWFGHRLELDAPPADEAALRRAFARWDAAHAGVDEAVGRRIATWETPLDVPFADVPERYAPVRQLGLERAPSPAAPRAAALPLRPAAGAAALLTVADAQAREDPALGEGYRAYLRWLYVGLGRRGAVTLAAWDDERPVAAATVVPAPDGAEARFQEVWTARPWRQRGLASALVDAAVARFADRTLRIAAVDGGAALRIYLRAGFAPTSRAVEASIERTTPV